LDSIGVPTPVAQSQDSLVLQDSFKGMNLGTLYLVFKDLSRQSVILGFPPQGVKTFADPNPANPRLPENCIIAARSETTRGKVLAGGPGPPDCLTGVRYACKLPACRSSRGAKLLLAVITQTGPCRSLPDDQSRPETLRCRRRSPANWAVQVAAGRPKSARDTEEKTQGPSKLGRAGRCRTTKVGQRH
jgi:hypothetical protein